MSSGGVEMWGDAEGAYSLKQSDSLAASLFQVTGPEHIPYNDARWQKLLLHYDQLVHLHNLGLSAPSSAEDDIGQDVVGSACRQAAKYSSTSSNLAALCLHVSRMIRDLQSSVEKYFAKDSATPLGDNDGSSTSTQKIKGSDGGDTKRRGASAKQRISLIGKARVTCGAINLLRILSHETIVQACCPVSNGYFGHDTNYTLKECFTYRARGGVNGSNSDQDAAMEIVSSTMAFLSSIGIMFQEKTDSAVLAIPEMYDVVVQILSLVLVLLSTQLYQPMVSSTELAIEGRQSIHFFMEKWMHYSNWQRTISQNNREEHMRHQQAQNLGQESTDGGGLVHNETLLLLRVFLHWMVNRPSPPRRSISSHYCELPKSIAKQMTNMTRASDGMYESHTIVMATSDTKALKVGAPDKISLKSADHGKNTDLAHQNTAIALGSDDTIDLSSPGHVSGDVTSWNGPSNLLFHPFRSLLLLSSTFFLLPIRLVRMAFHLLGHSQYSAIVNGSSHASDGDKVLLQQLQAHCEKKTGWNRTNNILWLTDCPISDMSSALLLILSNNCREPNASSSGQNPFRAELVLLNDNRWNSGEAEGHPDGGSVLPSPPNMSVLDANFELLFEAFGRVAHTEVGALMLYTLLQSSPALAQSISARFDLDTLVMPLLRSLYFSTIVLHAGPAGSPKSDQLPQLITLTPATRPFRAQSQLYVILILLLMFSQDPSFGRDSYRRVFVSEKAAKWYKETHMKEASLGSMILLVLLRTISFNLHRLHDEFLLSNCCAVLLNLSPHAVNLNDYVATRLVSVTTFCFKRYTALLSENGGVPEVEGDMSTPLGMHGETCRTLLQLVRHAVRPKCLEKNIHLLYALLRDQNEFQRMDQCASLGDTSSISTLVARANSIIQQGGDGMSADQTLAALKGHLPELKRHSAPDGLASDADSVASDVSDLGNLTFTYEEEADPEVFFVPYIWDVIVGTLTTTTMEWSRNKIQVFPLNEEAEVEFGTPAHSTTDESDVTHDNTPDVV